MNFQQGNLYHIYNQGINRQKIFFYRKNYLFFIEKIRRHVVPFADVIAWCLMPNHFHLMVEVKEITRPSMAGKSEFAGNIIPVTKSMTFNSSIGVMLRSYTRAVNLQQNRTGSLFREETKAICLNQIQDISPTWFSVAGGTIINIDSPDLQYPNTCYKYIHDNPVKAGMVNDATDWEFSSYGEIYGKNEPVLVEIKSVKKLKLF
jgi:putative transposase